MSRPHSTPSSRPKKIEVGDRFGRLVVIDGPFLMPSPAAGYPTRRISWFRCRCDCGKEHSVARNELRRNGCRSCGCLVKEKPKGPAAHGFRHGGACRDSDRLPEYNAWTHMQKRCYNTECKEYPGYGGRGIFVCQRWRDSFPAFYADMGKRPSKSHSIERINNDGPYSPENCRWATAKEQAENRRDNVFLEHDGKRLTQTEWARVTGIGATTIKARIKAGWSVVDVLTRPIQLRTKGYRCSRSP